MKFLSKSDSFEDLFDFCAQYRIAITTAELARYWLKREKLAEGMTMRRKESNVLCLIECIFES